jgi:hypothetical protein
LNSLGMLSAIFMRIYSQKWLENPMDIAFYISSVALKGINAKTQRTQRKSAHKNIKINLFFLTSLCVPRVFAFLFLKFLLLTFLLLTFLFPRAHHS